MGKSLRKVPPEGCLRVVKRSGRETNMTEETDNSKDQVRDGQLEESYKAAKIYRRPQSANRGAKEQR